LPKLESVIGKEHLPSSPVKNEENSLKKGVSVSAHSKKIGRMKINGQANKNVRGNKLR